ncbi:MAG: hypothetical protein MUW56_12870 [Chryseobacterium sp.]|uniref:hypothetical protein n=1 Tax=Chryseobacterium sp. TaxID=1871047 RepID=UPI0025C05DC5|nr:hypothetical protein [Chryseobacterium sp.]MCJ7934496.1 hypothetical protein [Chryseobacterium sp.]
MRKETYLLMLSVLSTSLFGQLGINTPSPSVTLDVQGKPTDISAMDGIRAPKLTETQLNAKSYGALQDGALVYVTAENGITTGQTINVDAVGYYYFNNAQNKWLKILPVGPANGNFWSLLGNSSTNPATHFLGTTDNQDLVIKTNNIESIRIKNDGKVGLGTNNPANKLHLVAPSDPLRIEGTQVSTSSGDKVLTIDPNGVVKTSLISSSNFAGYISADTTATNPSGSVIQIISVTNELLDANNEYASGTGFVPSSSGVYTFELTLTISSPTAVSTEYGTDIDRTVIGIVSNGLWVGRFHVEASVDPRTYTVKGIFQATAGSTYNFALAAPTGKTVTVLYQTSGLTGSGLGTFFGITRVR